MTELFLPASGSIKVRGVIFTLFQTETFEGYGFTDPTTNWRWEVYRHVNARPELARTYTAMVSEPGLDTRSRLLNSATWGAGRIQEADPLYGVSCRDDPRPLLRGIVRLIKLGGWPQDKQRRAPRQVKRGRR